MATIDANPNSAVEHGAACRSQRGNSRPRFDMRRLAAAAALLIAATWIVYAPALSNGFIWDDDYYPANRALTGEPSGLLRIWFVPRASPQYYPVTFTTFWIENRLWGVDPLGFHAVNVALHIGAALMFWRLLAKLNAPGAYFAALIFALHPVAVESVAWVTERKNTLSLFCGLAALLCLLGPLNLVDVGKSDERPSRNRRQYFFALALFIMAILSKSVACVVPAAACLLMYWKGRLSWRSVGLLMPFFVLGAAAGLHTAWLESTHVGATGADFNLTLAERFILAGRNVWFYAAKLVYPWPLSFIYPRWNPAEFHGAAWLYPLTAAALPLVLWTLRNRICRGPLTGVLYFGGALLPALGFVNVFPFRFSFVADHFQYHAMLGLIALAGAALAMVGSRIASQRVRSVLATATAVAVIIGYGGIVRARLPAYHDAEALWNDTLIHNPQAWIALNNLGAFYLQRGDLAGAEEKFRAGLVIKSDNGQLHNNLGMTYARGGRLNEALVEFRRAVELSPQYSRHHLNYADALAAAKQFDAAVVEYRSAAAINPLNPVTRQNLAWLLATEVPERRLYPREAVDHGLQANRITGGREPLVLDALAAAHGGLGEFAEARRLAGEALRLATEQRNAQLATDIRARLTLYEAGRPYSPARE